MAPYDGSRDSGRLKCRGMGRVSAGRKTGGEKGSFCLCTLPLRRHVCGDILGRAALGLVQGPFAAVGEENVDETENKTSAAGGKIV